MEFWKYTHWYNFEKLLRNRTVRKCSNAEGVFKIVPTCVQVGPAHWGSAQRLSGSTLMIMQLNNLTGLRWEIKYSGFGCIDYSWSFTQLFKVCFKRESRRKKKVGPYVGSLPIHFNSAWLNSRLLDLKINSGRTRTDRSRRICRLCRINADFKIFCKDFRAFAGFG